MQSELPPDKFHRKLAELTDTEKGFSFFTQYNFSGEPFIGTFNDSAFELTKNSFWQHIRSVKIVGTYLGNDNNKTEVNFKVGISKKLKVFNNVLLTILLFAQNTLLIVRGNFEISIFLTLNGWLVFMFLFGKGITYFSIFIVKQRFKEEFEIDVRPIDLYGYGGDGFKTG